MHWMNTCLVLKVWISFHTVVRVLEELVLVIFKDLNQDFNNYVFIDFFFFFLSVSKVVSTKIRFYKIYK
jgi:hypothetical protein